MAVALLEGSRTRHLTFAAGSRSGESYIPGDAVKKVVERHYPKIRIELLETGGTAENLTMLDAGSAELATAQADVTPGDSARILAIPYDDTFQLLVERNSAFHGFADLRGRRIALARSGGQFQSFLRVAEHFGLHESDRCGVSRARSRKLLYPEAGAFG